MTYIYQCYQDGKGQTFKDKIPNALRSCVVYSFMCRCCSVTYLGQTVRHLHLNTGVFPLTGSKSSNPTMSIVSFPILIALVTPPLLMILRLFLVALLQTNSSFEKVLTNSNPLSTYKAVRSLYFSSDPFLFLLL